MQKLMSTRQSGKENMGFKPKVTRTKHFLSPPLKAWAQEKANQAYESLRYGDSGLSTEVEQICAIDRAVPPHIDAEEKGDMDLTGMRIYGLVIRSDGHVLHSDALDAAGKTEGILLQEGDVYEIDVFDRHWTSVPSDLEKHELIFTVCIMKPDGRTHKKLGHDFKWTVLAGMVEERRRNAKI